MRVICVGNLESLLNDLKQKNMRTMLCETGMNFSCISELISDMFGRFPSGCHLSLPVLATARPVENIEAGK